jgi:hypothetical protein
MKTPVFTDKVNCERQPTCNSERRIHQHSEHLDTQRMGKVSVQEEQTSASGLTIEVNGCRIQFLSNTDMRLLAKVCQALQLS